MSYPSHVSPRSYAAAPRLTPFFHGWLGRALPFVIPLFVICHSAFGHPADQSDMRVRPKPHQLEIRFTFNLLTLTRFVGVDTDRDSKISMEELTAAQPRIAEYLNQHVRIEINQQKATLGSGVRFEALWPEPEKTPPMTEPDYAARKMDVTFNQIIHGKRLEDFWLGFEIFEQTGPMQTIRGVFEQDGRVEEVPFSVQEPEYLYDTGYADDPFEQEAEKKLAMPATEPAVKLKTAPAPAPIAAKLSATLASPIQPTVTEAPSEKRWWMVRAVVLMVLLVVGRKLQMSARSRLVSTRRRPRPR
jgi:hypothetical protein